MKKGLFKKLLPHLIAIIIFLIITAIFCKPALEGNVLNQTDITGWKGSAQNAFEYKAQHGHYPLWNPNLFSGMPNYQVAVEGKSILPDFTKILSLGLPKPMNFFFLACLCFYILCFALGLNPFIGILGSLAYAFSTYNAIIIGVGHESKMMAIDFMPLLLAGMIFTFNKKYWIGLAIATLGAYLEIAVNHPQINYYFLLVGIAITIAYLIDWIQKKEWKHILITGCIIIGSALIGIAGSAVTLMTSYEYSKATMRGGKAVTIEGNQVKPATTTGLDTSYAFQYSLGKAETAVILMPDAFGSSSSKPLSENSKVIEKLTGKGVPEDQAVQIANGLPRYWGGIDGVGTAGPPYIGAILCLLALIGFIIVKQPIRWGLLMITILAVLMSWGKYLPGFNSFLFEHLPMYNKFRAPSMILVILEFTIPIMAALTLQYILYREKSRELLKADFRKILYAVGGLLVLLIILYLMMDYSSWVDQRILQGYTDPKTGSTEIARSIISGMKADRQSMFGGQLLRTFAFATVVIGCLYLYLRNIIKPMVVVVSLALISIIDLLIVDKEYLNADNYVAPEELASQSFVPNAADQRILQDKDPDFRVFNSSPDWTSESRTSYFHKSIGGYHPAKLSIYQDLIDKYLAQGADQNILNMLNAKYFIFTDPKTNQPQSEPNPSSYGPCWRVKNVKLVDGPVQEIQDIGNTHLRDTAIVQKTFSNTVTQPQWDSAAIIKLAKFDNDTMQYSFSSSKPQFAVFSEVYYPFGWNAYIDGKKTDYCKADYVLRGLSIPAGQHSIKFIFEPSTYKKAVTIAYIASFLIAIFFLGGLFMEWRNRRKSGVISQ
ncbi:MAG: YfhO family protein [Chitinophagales bacterium]